MRFFFLNARTAALAILLAATTVSVRLGGSAGAKAGTALSIAVLVIAFAKALVVINEFMEVRRAPLPLRVAAFGWAIAACTAIVILYPLQSFAPH